MDENTNKAVSLAGLQAASALIATKAEVKEQIEAASLGSVTFATNEEILALFQEPASGETT